MQDWKKIKDELNSIRLKGCEEVRIGDVLHYSLEFYYNDTYDIISAIKSIRRIIGHSFLTTYEVQKAGEGNNIFFLSSSISNRADHVENMHKVMNTVDNRIDIVSSNYKVNMGNVRFLPIIFSWNKSLKRVFPNRIRRIFYISHLYRVFLDYKLIKKKLDGMNLKSFVTYCDVLEADNYFTQMMNYHDIITVTLQHGLLSADKSCEWGVLGSKSDYFFCHGEYMLDIAEKLHFENKDRMKKVGLVSYADSKEKFLQCSGRQKVIGVILDGGNNENNNKHMIEIAEMLGRRRGLLVLVKLHPTSSLEDYMDVVSNSELCYREKIDIKDFIKMIDMGIVCGTTSMLEMLYNNKPVFIYRKDNIYYPDWNNENINKIGFEDIEELIKILEENNQETINEVVGKMRSYFIGDGIPFDTYKNAFAEIGVE